MGKNIYRRNLIKVSMSLCLASSISFAGAMGDVQKSSSGITPYLGMEATYTWAGYGNITANGITPSSSLEQWGGRLSVGMTLPYTERVRFSAEAGGGYFGKKNGTLFINSTDASVDGYDLMFGAIYQIERFEKLNVFGSFGFMSQNNRVKVTRDFSDSGSGLSGNTVSSYNNTQILPEIKAGLLYSLNPMLDLTVSYMHVFGSNYKVTSNQNSNGDVLVQSGVEYLQNPLLNSILFGIRYNFV